MRSRWLCLTVLTLFLGCASEPGAAQEQPGRGEQPAKEEPRKGGDPQGGPKDGAKDAAAAPKPKAEKLDPRVYRATVVDRFMKEDEKPFLVTKVVLFVPEVSLFGGSAGKESKTLELQRGSASIEVPFERLRGIEVGKVTEDRLEVKVEVESKKPEGRFLSGTVKASLELKGVYEANDLRTTVKLREVRTLKLELDPANEKKKD